MLTPSWSQPCAPSPPAETKGCSQELLPRQLRDTASAEPQNPGQGSQSSRKERPRSHLPQGTGTARLVRRSTKTLSLVRRAHSSKCSPPQKAPKQKGLRSGQWLCCMIKLPASETRSTPFYHTDLGLWHLGFLPLKVKPSRLQKRPVSNILSFLSSAVSRVPNARFSDQTLLVCPAKPSFHTALNLRRKFKSRDDPWKKSQPCAGPPQSSIRIQKRASHYDDRKGFCHQHLKKRHTGPWHTVSV